MMLNRHRVLVTVLACWSIVIAAGFIPGCAAKVDPDPLATLDQPTLLYGSHLQAIEAVRESDDPAVDDVLERILMRPGYTVAVREAALDALVSRDSERAMRALRRTMPQTTALGWLTRLCEIIPERGWVELTPALISSWARPMGHLADELKRPEYIALARMHGEQRVTDLIFTTFMESTSVAEQGLRTRCWNLLHRLGQRDRLIQLLISTDAAPEDTMLMDLRAAAVDFGLVPYTREEILWLRQLRQPEHAEFWSQAAAVVAQLDPQRRSELELRDLPILVSASLHDPDLLTMNRDELYDRVDAYLQGQRHHYPESNFEGYGANSKQRLFEHRDVLTWGDLAAMLIAVRALQVPEVVDHLFHYAERDRQDTSTEYGGIIRLDAKDRFEVLEFHPVTRHHDNKFIASQAMLDAAYTSIFHFHFHVQRYNNARYAGPGHGDMNYADNLRSNCLVFTFINENTLNVDFYRHSRVVVDLGEIRRSR